MTIVVKAFLEWGNGQKEKTKLISLSRYPSRKEAITTKLTKMRHKIIHH